MNILFFIPSYGGGAGKVICSLANYFCEKGHIVYLGSYVGNGCPYKINQKVQRIDFFIKKNKKIYSEINALLGIRRLYFRQKLDVIISFGTQGNFDCLLATVGLAVPVIVCERSDPYQENSRIFRIRRKFYKLANAAVFQTEEAARYYGDIFVGKKKIIENPVEESQVSISPFFLRKKEIVTVTRLTNKQKRLDILIKAFSEVKTVEPDYCLKIIGDGEDRAIIEDMICDMQLQDCVELFGNSNSVIEDIKESQIFVITSDFEGISNSMLEALSIGLPVVATDTPTGGARTMIQNNLTGILVPCGDVDAVKNAILQYIRKPTFADECGMNAKKTMKQYTPERIYERWYEYVMSIAKKGKNNE